MVKRRPAVCVALSAAILAFVLSGCGRKPQRYHEGGGSSSHGDRHFRYASVSQDGDVKVAVFRVWKASEERARQERSRCWDEVRRIGIPDSLRVFLCVEGSGTIELALSTSQDADVRSFVRGKVEKGDVLERVLRPAARAKGIELAW